MKLLKCKCLKHIKPKSGLDEAEQYPPFENNEKPFRIAFFSATATEVAAFQKGNEEFEGNFTIDFYESRLTLESVSLVNGAEGVCIFVHDDASAEVLKVLKQQGVKILALRCSGTNNVDQKTAMDLGETRIIRGISSISSISFRSFIFLSISFYFFLCNLLCFKKLQGSPWSGSLATAPRPRQSTRWPWPHQ